MTFRDVKQIKRFIGAVFLLVLFVAYQTSITAFTHVHYVNGVLIAHSHPFQGSHTHTKTELVVIGRLSTFDSPEVDVCCNDLHPFFHFLAVIQTEPIDLFSKGKSVQVISLRAPPALITTENTLRKVFLLSLS